MPVSKPTKPFSAIVLTATLRSGQILGEPGDRIEITEENRAAAIALYQERGCKLILDPIPAKTSEPAAPAVADVDLDSDESEDGLADIDDAASVDELDIPDRYKAALKEAGIKTIADAKAHADLASVPGISKSIAAKILGS